MSSRVAKKAGRKPAGVEPVPAAPMSVQLTEREQRIRTVGALDVQIEATELRLHELRQRRDAIIRLLADSAKPETTTPAE